MTQLRPKAILFKEIFCSLGFENRKSVLDRILHMMKCNEKVQMNTQRYSTINPDFAHAG